MHLIYLEERHRLLAMISSTVKIKTRVTCGQVCSCKRMNSMLAAQSNIFMRHYASGSVNDIPRDYSVLFYDKIKSRMVKLNNTVLTNGSGPFHAHGTIIDPSHWTVKIMLCNSSSKIMPMKIWQ